MKMEVSIGKSYKWWIFQPAMPDENGG